VFSFEAVSLMFVKREGVVVRSERGFSGLEWANSSVHRFDCGPQGTFSQVCAYGTACIVEKID